MGKLRWALGVFVECIGGMIKDYYLTIKRILGGKA